MTAASVEAIRKAASSRTPVIEDPTAAGWLYRPITFAEPWRVVAPESWLDYTPFAFWIVDALRPRVFVELGCHSGNSYASFAQAVQTLGLPTACYGVDTWRGDPHAGFFDESVFEEWSAYHARTFGAFSQLIRAKFDEAAEHFTEGTVDLLHLDGYHTFEAISHDFDTWRAKLSNRSVLLCHDINVREGDFGAWRLWERLRDEYPSFEFLHGHGLGVLGVGDQLPEPVAWLLSLGSRDPERVNLVRLFFARLGAAVLGRYTTGTAVTALRSELAARQDDHRQEIETRDRTLHQEVETRDARHGAELLALQDAHRLELAARDDQLTATSAEIARLNETLAAVNGQVQEMQADADRQRADLTSSADRVTAQALRIDQLTALLQALDTDLQERQRGCDRSAVRIANLRRRVGTLKALLRHREADIAQLRRDVDQIPAAISARDTIIDRLDSEAATLAEELHRGLGREYAVGGSRIRLAAVSLADPVRQPPTIVVVSHVGPWQPKSGNEYRLRRMLNWYREKGYRIIPVLAPLPGEDIPRDGMAAIAAEFGNAVQCHRDGRVEHLLKTAPDVLPSLDGVFSRPLDVLLGENGADDDLRRRRLLDLERMFCHDVVASAVLQLQRALGPHVLQVEYIWMTRFLPLVRRDVLKIVDTIDVFSSIPQKVASFGIKDVVIEPAEEAERLHRADLAIAIQEEERAELRRFVSAVPVITAGVDFDMPAVPSAPPAVCRVLYVGSGNPRNRRGLEDFLRFAWPRIRQAVPDAELRVAGNVAGSLAGVEPPGVRLLGAVADLAAEYRNARLVINPAVAGTGLKIKVLEALSHGRPLVAWPSGVDGLDPELAALCRVARDWFEFSEHVTAGLVSPATDSFAVDSRAIVAKHITAKHVYASLASTLDAFFGQHAGD